MKSMMIWYFFFFFSSRRRHTRLQGDWSSDVCSSDLIVGRTFVASPPRAGPQANSSQHPPTDERAPSAPSGLYAYTRISFPTGARTIVAARCAVAVCRTIRPVLSIRPPHLRDRDASPARLSVSHTRRDTMTINVGDRIPSVTLKQLTSEGVKEFTTDEIFRGKRVVLIAVPGAFTPACSQRHLPGYVDKATDIKAKGIDEIACVAVNDAFVMGAWGRDQKAEGKVRMLADGSGDFTRALGLELDLSKGGLGVRSKRYSMLVDDGVVKSLNVEQQPGQVDISGAEAMLKAL